MISHYFLPFDAHPLGALSLSVAPPHSQAKEKNLYFPFIPPRCWVLLQEAFILMVATGRWL